MNEFTIANNRGSSHFKVCLTRVQRKSFLQLASRASWSEHLLAQTSFQLAPKTFWLAELTSQSFCYLNSSKNITYMSGKFKTEFTSPIAKFTSLGYRTLLSLHVASLQTFCGVCFCSSHIHFSPRTSTKHSRHLRSPITDRLRIFVKRNPSCLFRFTRSVRLLIWCARS